MSSAEQLSHQLRFGSGFPILTIEFSLIALQI